MAAERWQLPSRLGYMQCGCFQIAAVADVRLPLEGDFRASGNRIWRAPSKRCAVPIRELGITLGVYQPARAFLKEIAMCNSPRAGPFVPA
jgi:hypothetical protein